MVRNAHTATRRAYGKVAKERTTLIALKTSRTAKQGHSLIPTGYMEAKAASGQDCCGSRQEARGEDTNIPPPAQPRMSSCRPDFCLNEGVSCLRTMCGGTSDEWVSTQETQTYLKYSKGLFVVFVCGFLQFLVAIQLCNSRHDLCV